MGQAENLALASPSTCHYRQNNIRALNPAQKYPTWPQNIEMAAVFLLLSEVAGGICLDA